MGSSLDKDDFCSSETRHNWKTAHGPKLFILVGRLQEQKPWYINKNTQILLYQAKELLKSDVAYEYNFLYGYISHEII